LVIKEEENPKTGQILDLEENKLFPPYNLESIIAQGYWFDYTGDEDQTKNLLNIVNKLSKEEE
jgi:hypothetical protein